LSPPQLGGRFRPPDGPRGQGRGCLRPASFLRFRLRQRLRLRPAAFVAVRRQNGAPYADADQVARYVRRPPMIVLRALGALLSYPRDEVRQALPEIADAIRASPLIAGREREGLLALIDDLGT